MRKRRVICFLRFDEELSPQNIAQRFHQLYPNRRIENDTKSGSIGSVFKRPKIKIFDFPKICLNFLTLFGKH